MCQTYVQGNETSHFYGQNCLNKLENIYKFIKLLQRLSKARLHNEDYSNGFTIVIL